MLVTSLNPVSLSLLIFFYFFILLTFGARPIFSSICCPFYCLCQKIGYDNAAAVAKKAHKEGSTLKVIVTSQL